MRIKRFCAPDIRQAMRLVREELGSDAVILSNRTVDEGVEIVAAMDFDQEMFQKEVAGEPQKPLEAESNRRASDRKSTGQAEARSNAEASSCLSEPGLPNDHRKSPDSSVNAKLANGLKAGLKRNAERGTTTKSAENMAFAMPVSRDRPIFDPDPVLKEMRKEFDQMRDLLNSRLTEISWTESLRHNPVCREILRRLNQCGFSETIGRNILKQVDEGADLSGAWAKVTRSVSRHLAIHDDNLLDYGGIVALVGPTGVGKTTSIAKIAARFCLKYGNRKIALVAADNYRIAAYEQLNTYGRILDVPVRTAHDNKELVKVLKELMDKRLILIDTAGISQRDMHLADQFPLLYGKEFPIRTYLVMSAATQYATMKEIIEAFKIFDLHAGILTKLDETVSVAGAVSALIENRLPLSFVCDGQKVPENLRRAKEYGVVEQCFAAVSRKALPADGASDDRRLQACG